MDRNALMREGVSSTSRSGRWAEVGCGGGASWGESLGLVDGGDSEAGASVV